MTPVSTLMKNLGIDLQEVRAASMMCNQPPVADGDELATDRALTLALAFALERIGLAPEKRYALLKVAAVEIGVMAKALDDRRPPQAVVVIIDARYAVVTGWDQVYDLNDLEWVGEIPGVPVFSAAINIGGLAMRTMDWPGPA